MIDESTLDKSLISVGLVIGLLTRGSDGKLSVNTDWFASPISQLESAPTRVKTLVDVLDQYFIPIDGASQTLLGNESQWFDIYSGQDGVPTGLCLVAPTPGSSSGTIGLGVFTQIEVDELTISMCAQVPLFYLNDGEAPQFILAGGGDDSRKCKIAIEAYSEGAVPDSPLDFNFMSAVATVDVSKNFDTSFDLSFKNVDPTTGNPTPISPTSDVIIAGALNALVTQGSYWLSSYIGDSTLTIGDLLTAAGLINQQTDSTSDKTTYSFDEDKFNTLKASGPVEVLKNFLIALVNDLLEPLVSGDEPLLAIEGGGVYVAHDAATNSYGLRLVIPDFQVTAPGGAGTQVKVQLGKGFTDETSDNSWLQRIIESDTQNKHQQTQPPQSKIDPGVEILFLKFDGTTLTTTSHIALNSIGLDISGAGDAPLFDIDGYTLKGAELRTYLDSDGWNYGFAIRLDNVAFPVGPDFSASQNGSTHTNAVAQNLLAAGGGSSDTSAVNPGFSAEAGYISDHNPLLEIFDPEGNKTDLIWFPIQRRFGPLSCQKVGLKIDTTADPVLGVVFDGGVSLGGLNLYLDQLSIDAHLKEIAHTSGYGLDLQGIDVDFSNGSVEINAGLLKGTDPQGNISYDGEALIKAGNLTVAALGSYSSLSGGGTSMFIFGVLNEPLGGPACFYVTGLMAGFGYNRALKIPDQDKVPDFPLLAGLNNASAIGGSNPKPAEALAKLEDWVPVKRGEYWLAAGIQFTTFKIINTNALVIVEFGDDLTIAILGLSILKQPISGNTYVYAELGIEVVILPDQGEFKASAVLDPSSYVLTPDAHLTGGFAFYSWWGNSEHAGDFVLTLGGYHPAFNVPAHYPQEPRLGINWQISDHLSMVGTAYFALTPSAMMAGCGLKLAYEDGDLKAWLKAQADIIIFWKPFYVIADISISVGVSYRISLLFTHVTLSVELGAEFHLWGPPIGGQVHIDWYIISFTIGFGASKNIPTEIAWQDFKEMLPAQTKPQPAPALRSAAPKARAMSKSTPMLRAAAPTTSPTACLSITSNAGLIRSHQADDLTLWLVRASQFQFSVGSAIPASALVAIGADSTTNLAGTKVGVQRVNGGISPVDYQSQQTITIVKVLDGNFGAHAATNCATPSTDNLADIGGWEIDVLNKNVPQAMWGPPTTDATINGDSSTINAAVGVTMYPKPPVITSCTPEMVIDDLFEDRTINVDDQFMLPLSQTQTAAANTPLDVDSFADISLINDQAIYQRRSNVFATLSALGINAWSNDQLNAIAAGPGKAFADEPMEGSTVLSST